MTDSIAIIEAAINCLALHLSEHHHITNTEIVEPHRFVLRPEWQRFTCALVIFTRYSTQYKVQLWLDDTNSILTMHHPDQRQVPSWVLSDPEVPTAFLNSFNWIPNWWVSVGSEV